MTISKVLKIIRDNNIPEDVTIESDSGWECGPTKMDGIWYNEKENKIIFTQDISKYSDYYKDPNWQAIST